MTTAQEPAEEDTLRRRLYRADATEADVQRYRDLVGPDGAEPGAAARADESAPAPARSRHRLAAGITVAAVALSVVTATTLLQQPAAPPLRPTASAVPDARIVVQDIGDGQILRVDPAEAGGPAPISVWIDGTAAAAQRFDGTGDAVLLVDLPSASSHRQRAVLSLYSTAASTIEWRALRRATRPDRTLYEQIVARGTIEAHRDFATPSTFDYSGSAPARIALEAPAGVRWTLLITGIPSTISELH
ncbi:hypothetical protein [uncultured Amnibacterium sp.]|uniref:hypothetical protein n=1 Tax=uncultured Amnibacterium sp. TaxID=1631851 RepID=UPI0035CC363C